jgi:pyridoxine 5-phosphate synthase
MADKIIGEIIELGVNIDHIATVRQARKTVEPDPVWAAVEAELGGADGITVHLREDRRHIQDRDVEILRQTVRCKLNLEMACVNEIVDIACRIKPDQATLVPEKRQEITTEGGLDVCGQKRQVSEIVKKLQDSGIAVSLFLDPDLKQIEAGIKTGCEAIEIHTGQYANSFNPAFSPSTNGEGDDIERIIAAGKIINSAGLRLHAGHGLNYHNVLPIAGIAGMRELNIGHSIISRALLTGLRNAVAEMKSLLQ